MYLARRLMILAAAVPVLALSSASSPAAGRVYVGEPTLNCGGACLGPSALKFKPSSLWLREQTAGGIYEARLTKLTWTHWGQSSATARGRVRHGDPDNGFHNSDVTVTLSKLSPAGCSDDAGRFRAYNRASLRTSDKTLGQRVWRPLLAC